VAIKHALRCRRSRSSSSCTGAALSRRLPVHRRPLLSLFLPGERPSPDRSIYRLISMSKKYGSFLFHRGGGSSRSAAPVVNEDDDASAHREDFNDVVNEEKDGSNDESTSLLLVQQQMRHRQPMPLAIDDDDDDDFEGGSPPSAHWRKGEESPRRQRRPRGRADRSRSRTSSVWGWWVGTLALSLLVVAMTLTLYESIPSTHEMRLVSDYDLSYWDLPRLRSAQALALASASFLQDADAAYQDGKTVVHKITRHKSTSEHHSYMNPPEGCESTVVVVRHCEKGSVREHCAHVGFERAVYLSTLFGDREHERWPSPAFIFAEGPGQRRNQRKMNFREMETVGPLADKVGVKVDDRCGCLVVVVNVAAPGRQECKTSISYSSHSLFCHSSATPPKRSTTWPEKSSPCCRADKCESS
jgi:hypothetical protein